MPAEASSLPLCFLSKCADSYEGVARLLLSQHWFALVSMVLGSIGLYYARRWWQREAAEAAGLALAFARFCLLAVFTLGCFSWMAFAIYQSVPGTPPQPPAMMECTASATKTEHHYMYRAYEAYPTLQPISCPERGSKCYPPVIFTWMNIDIGRRSMTLKGYELGANNYKQPAWAEVANDLSVGEEYIEEVTAILERASEAVEMRDMTINRYMHRAQTEYAQLMWSRNVDPDIASGRTVPNKTSTRILCGFLRDTAEIQNRLLMHPSMIELEQSIYGQQSWTVQTYAHINLTETLSKQWLRPVDTKMLELTKALKWIFVDRIAKDSSYAKNFQKYKALEQDALSRLQQWERTMCARADQEDRGEEQEKDLVQTDLAVMDISELMWDFGRQVRMGASQVGAYAWKEEEVKEDEKKEEMKKAKKKKEQYEKY